MQDDVTDGSLLQKLKLSRDVLILVQSMQDDLMVGLMWLTLSLKVNKCSVFTCSRFELLAGDRMLLRLHFTPGRPCHSRCNRAILVMVDALISGRSRRVLLAGALSLIHLILKLSETAMAASRGRGQSDPGQDFIAGRQERSQHSVPLPFACREPPEDDALACFSGC